jgi:hypothetical protein
MILTKINEIFKNSLGFPLEIRFKCEKIQIYYINRFKNQVKITLLS